MRRAEPSARRRQVHSAAEVPSQPSVDEKDDTFGVRRRGRVVGDHDDGLTVLLGDRITKQA
jgi:hypothetical protein